MAPLYPLLMTTTTIEHASTSFTIHDQKKRIDHILRLQTGKWWKPDGHPNQKSASVRAALLIKNFQFSTAEKPGSPGVNARHYQHRKTRSTHVMVSRDLVRLREDHWASFFHSHRHQPLPALQTTNATLNPSRTRTISLLSHAPSFQGRLKRSIPLNLRTESIAIAQVNTKAEGSFSTTAPATRHLQEFLHGGPSQSTSTYTRGRRPSLASLIWPWPTSVSHPDPDARCPALHASPSSSTSPNSPVPWLSRTSPSSNTLDSMLNGSDPSLPATPIELPYPSSGALPPLHPVLAAAERASKLSCNSRCVTCDTPGYDFSRCARCGDTWCSRACRLPNGEKRHTCKNAVPIKLWTADEAAHLNPINQSK